MTAAGGETSKTSLTDPEAGHIVRDGKPQDVLHLYHRTVGGRDGIIPDSHATLANGVIPASISACCNVSGDVDLDVDTVGLNAGYATSGLPAGWNSAASSASPGIGDPPRRTGHDDQQNSLYEAEHDGYRYPHGRVLA